MTFDELEKSLGFVSEIRRLRRLLEAIATGGELWVFDKVGREPYAPVPAYLLRDFANKRIEEMKSSLAELGIIEQEKA
ncbi:MAG: hypothetical protein KGL39_45010 [Patescibacteria group bacterium]|nr:hypothetical protein [Patescibacteria group bacterium]